jgi:uncharacterized protein with FMN-binding domain
MLIAKRESLAGKLLLSSALVAVSLGYGWWQRQNSERPAIAMAPMPVAPSRPAPVAPVLTPPVEPQVQAPAPKDTPVQLAAAPQAKKMSAATPPQPVAPAAPEAPPQPSVDSAPPPALTQQQAMQMNLPTEGPSPAFPLVTGNPEPGAVVAVAAGLYLADGDYVSDRHGMMWGDLRVRITIHGGAITGVQVLQYPDHRSQSLYLSQMALPILESEVIKSQKAQVDFVSSATDTSYSFQDAIADAIAKATRG